MHDVDEPANPAPGPSKQGADEELDQLESDLENVDSALRALDASELDEAEALTHALGRESPVED